GRPATKIGINSAERVGHILVSNGARSKRVSRFSSPPQIRQGLRVGFFVALAVERQEALRAKGAAMDETLHEFFDSRGVNVRVDREAGVVRGVKILGLESRNGRTYLPAALAGSIRLYEGAKVNVNHPKGHPQAPRDYQDRIGV